MVSILSELKRRNVIRVTVAYLVTAWLLVQVMEITADAFDAPAWVLKLVMTLLILGLVPTVIFSWVYELTPEGIKRESEVRPEDSVTAHTGKKLNVAVIVLSLLAIGLFITDKIWLDEDAHPGTGAASEAAGNVEASATPGIQDNSIAVLPFVDLSPAGDQEYFSDGIAEEVLNVLVKVEALSVASRTSSFQFKERDIGIPEIARSLKVRHVLEGSVRKAGNTLRITAQLIDTSNDRHLWSDRFDRPLTAENIFEIQDEIARAIVDALSLALGIDADSSVSVAAPTDNLTAYDLYLQAKPLFQSRSNLLEADAFLARAVELDPGFVKAWEMRAALYAVAYEYVDELTREESTPLALQFVDRVLELDPENAMAIAVRANIHSRDAQLLIAPRDWAEIIADFQRALDIDPNIPGAWTWLGLAHVGVGEVEQSLGAWEECLSIDPFYTPCAENVLVALASLGRDEEALERYRVYMNAGLVNPIYTPLAMLARLDEEMAFKTLTSSRDALFGWRRHDELYEAYKSPGKHEELARDAIRFARARTTLSEDDVALLFLPLGAYDLRPFPLYMWDAAYADYRQSPQFKAYVRDSNIYAYWREHGFPPQCRAVGDDDFQCD